jgi:hypothetical protein
MIREEVLRRVNAALGREAADYRLRHSCPACTYKLQDEGDLIFEMLVTMDGNDSLKRILRRDPPTTSGEEKENLSPKTHRLGNHENIPTRGRWVGNIRFRG